MTGVFVLIIRLQIGNNAVPAHYKRMFYKCRKSNRSKSVCIHSIRTRLQRRSRRRNSMPEKAIHLFLLHSIVLSALLRDLSAGCPMSVYCDVWWWCISGVASVAQQCSTSWIWPRRTRYTAYRVTTTTATTTTTTIIITVHTRVPSSIHWLAWACNVSATCIHPHVVLSTIHTLQHQVVGL